jgi:hypothetical protein
VANGPLQLIPALVVDHVDNTRTATRNRAAVKWIAVVEKMPSIGRISIAMREVQ